MQSTTWRSEIEGERGGLTSEALRRHHKFRRHVIIVPNAAPRHGSDLSCFRSISSMLVAVLYVRDYCSVTQLTKYGYQQGVNLIINRILPTQYILYKYRGSSVSVKFKRADFYLYKTNPYVQDSSNGRRWDHQR